MRSTGVIFDIKEGAVHDGPGLRQTVFLKGCPLRCRWCHNPEGLEIRKQLMLSPNGCTRCGKCWAVCPKAEGSGSFGMPRGCDACGRCAAACPQRLRKIVGEEISPEQLAERLLANAPYYASTGGGVTFSGGEPLMQADFVVKTLALLGPDVHKAVETSGFGSPEAFLAFRQAFDLVMLDLKCMDDQRHQAFTGVSNRKILANAELLCQGETPFIIRIPVIPGVNDNDAHYEAVAKLVSGAPALQRVELLPYHVTAGAKYAMVGETYQPGFDVDHPIQVRLSLFEQYGVRSCVL